MSRRAAAQSLPGPADGMPLLRVLLATGLACLALLALYWRTLAEMAGIWDASDTYDYAWAVAPTAALLLWWRRRELAAAAPGGSLLGVVAAAAAALLWFGGELLAVAELRHFALVAGLLAVALAGLGRTGFGRLLPCFLVLFFLVPTGQFLVQPLREVTVFELQAFTWLAGLSFEREGFAVFIEGERYVVVDDCAGLPYVLIGAFLGSVFGNLNFRSLWKVGLFSVAGALAGIVANGLRVAAIAAYDLHRGVQMPVSEHSVFELPALAFLFVALLLLHARLRPEPPREALAPRGAVAAGRPPARAVVTAFAAALLLAAAPLLAPPRPAAAPAPVAAGFLPPELAGWRRGDLAASAWEGGLGAADRASARYRDASGRPAEVLHLRAASDRSFPADSLAGAAPAGAGWMAAARQQRLLCDGERCLPAVQLRYVLKDSERARHVVWTYAQRHDATVSQLELRARSAWRALSGESGDVRLLAVMTDSEATAGDRLSERQAAALLLALLELDEAAESAPRQAAR